MIRCVLAAAGVAVAAGLAQAGAWTLPEGELQLFATTLGTNGQEAFDAEGTKAAFPAFVKNEVLLYGEYGLWDGITVVAKAGAFEWQEAGRDAPAYELSPSGLGVRVRALAGSNWSVSVEGLAGMLGALEGRPTRPALDDTVEAELRVSGGISLALWGRRLFGDLQAGARSRFDEAGEELLLDAVGGAEIWGGFGVLFESRNRMTLEDGPALFREHKVEAAVTYAVTQSSSVRAGWMATVAGANAVAEAGPTVGFAYRW